MGEHLALRLLRHETERDKQTRIGPSTAGSLCDKCIAEAMSGKRSVEGKWWLAGRIGSGVHAVLDEKIKELMTGYSLSETKTKVTFIPGYGWMKGTADLAVLPNNGPWAPVTEPEMWDWKTTDRAKLPFIKQSFLTPPDDDDSIKLKQTRMKTQGYINQCLLYTYGLREHQDIPVERCHLSFICRDGKITEDTFEVTFRYNNDRVLDIIERLNRIWDTVDDYRTHHEHCYYAKKSR